MPPKRIQRKRTKGWRMPPNCVSCTRPGKYGNPFPIDGGDVPDAAASVEYFRDYAAEQIKRDPHWLDELRGKDLACWCALDAVCHVDVLLEISNV